MIKVAIDAMGGDHAPGEIIKGVMNALSSHQDLKVYLVGNEEKIYAELGKYANPRGQVQVIPAPEIITGDDDPGISIRRKKGASMVVALKMVQSGEADAVISAGNTGALMAGGLLYLGRLPGISRPALLAVFPTFKGEAAVVLDVGANMDARPEQMIQYALMGRIYAGQVLNRKDPRVALLNVGSEENKGNMQVKKALVLFREHVGGFMGNIEANQVLEGIADVIVCDGFVGNVLLKAVEGMARGVLGELKGIFSGSWKNRIGSWFIYGSLIKLKQKMDDSEYGGAPLVGVNGICIKCHGSSRARAIENALCRQIYPLVQNRVNLMFQEALEESGWLKRGLSSHGD